MTLLYKYTFEGEHPWIPKGSKVALVDSIDGRFATVYNGMWFGYYDFSLFKPILNGK